MSDKTSIDQRKCLTPEFRASFPAIFKAKAFKDQEPKFSVTMLFDKKTDLSVLKKAARFACEEKWGSDKNKWPKNLRMPFRDGAEKSDLEGYADCIMVNSNSKNRPGVVNQKLDPIMEDDNQFYAGCYARASVIAFAYDQMGNRGVSFSLQNVQKLRDGEPFSGRRKAEDEFSKVDDGSDNADNYKAAPATDEDDYDLG